FYLKEAFLSAKKNSIISFATVICLTATLIIMGIFLILSLNLNIFLANVESQLIAVSYLKDNLSEEEIRKLAKEISGLDGVREVHYISKEEALQQLKEDLDEHADILAGMPENPLPSSLEIKVYETDYLEEVALQVAQYNGIEEVNYGGEITNNVILLFDFIRKTGLGIIAVLLGISILIMFSVIKISIHSRQQEIEIMALVGATSWFIRWPFIIEGFLKGLVSSFIAFLLLSKAYQYFIEQMEKIIPFIPIGSEQEFIIKIGIILILIGTLIGIFGSMLSLRRINYEEL
ncbi:MAG: permease-like cell division protein FtsX, partial [Atribacterota bacterium]|nr:permease-like cell division protein FtsX [Atribacterota bacterium]